VRPLPQPQRPDAAQGPQALLQVPLLPVRQVLVHDEAAPQDGRRGGGAARARPGRSHAHERRGGGGGGGRPPLARHLGVVAVVRRRRAPLVFGILVVGVHVGIGLGCVPGRLLPVGLHLGGFALGGILLAAHQSPWFR